MTKTTSEGWAVMSAHPERVTRKGVDAWSAVGDSGLERFEFADKGGNQVIQRKPDQPPPEATVYRQEWVAKSVAADLSAGGHIAVVLKVNHEGDGKMVGAGVEQLKVKASGAWEVKGA